MRWWPNSDCNAFTTDSWTVTWWWQILVTGKRWDCRIGWSGSMSHLSELDENDRSAKTNSGAVTCHEWFLGCNMTMTDSRAVMWPVKDGIAMLDGQAVCLGVLKVAWSLKDVFRMPWWMVWPDFWAWALWLTRSGHCLAAAHIQWKRTWHCVHSQKE
jgi:hypothetical protein